MELVNDYNERDVLRLVAQGDDHAFRQLFHHYKSKIYSVALKITKSETHAEELLQDVFLIIWLKRESLSQITDFASYLFIVARNEAYRTLKAAVKRRGSEQITEEVNLHRVDTDDPISLHEYQVVLQKAIERLPPQQKHVYKLIREEGYTREQTAEIMAIGSETVKTHLAKAEKAIRAFCQAQFEMALIAFMLIQTANCIS
jgi:RNA polymerase sigma-70 factor (ECF subfamily)